MNILKEAPTTDFFLVQTPDVGDPATPSPAEETFGIVNSNDSSNTIAEEDPSYYFQDAIFLVCRSHSHNWSRLVISIPGRKHVLQSPTTPVRAEFIILS